MILHKMKMFELLTKQNETRQKSKHLIIIYICLVPSTIWFELDADFFFKVHILNYSYKNPIHLIPTYF